MQIQRFIQWGSTLNVIFEEMDRQKSVIQYFPILFFCNEQP